MSNINTSPSFQLFARPSLLEGMARILDLGTTLQNYNDYPSAKQADSNALFNDWQAVGQDIMNAIDKYENQEQKNPSQ